MRLKKLVIIGFKSFADKVAIDFDCDIIGIVGPNGCGKSNIVDAFRWVMGEQSAKSLRGEKMYDVLFAGADKRPPLGFAEVSITLSDIQNALPTPYDELTITRRLHRSGESEYSINKQPARLRDIQELLLGSGLGKHAFSIFEQGKLDQIVHLNPIDRRIIFDEAAGTSRFLLRKKEAMRKLSGVSENYHRIHDVHAEIEKQAKLLKKQAHHAKSFQENKERLHQLEKEALLLKLHEVNAKNSKLQTQLETTFQNLELLQSSIEDEENHFQDAKNILRQSALSAKEKQSLAAHLETKTRVKEAEIKQQKQYLLELKSREKDIKAYLLELKREIQEHRAQLEKGRSAFETSESKKELEENRYKEKKASHTNYEERVTAFRNELKEKQKEHLQTLNEERKLQREYHEKKVKYETALSRLNVMEEEERQHHSKRKALELQIEEQQKKVGQLTIEIDSFKQELNQAENQQKVCRAKNNESQLQQQKLIRSLTESEARQRILVRMKEEFEGLSSGAKFLLKEASNKKSSLYGKIKPLFEYLIPKKGYENLTAAAMKIYCETLLVESEEDFKQVLAFARKKEVSDFSLFIRDSLAEKQAVNQKQGSLEAYIDQNEFSSHFTAGIEVIDESHFYDRFGVFFRLSQKRSVQSTFSRESELKELADTIQSIQKEEKEISEWIEDNSRKLKQAEERRAEILEMRRKKEMDLVQENFILQRALSDLQSSVKTSAALEKEKKRLAELGADRERLILLESLAQKKELEASSLAETIRKQEMLLENEEQGFEESKTDLQKLSQNYFAIRDEWQQLAHSINLLETKLSQRVAQERKFVQEIEDAAQKVERLFKTTSDLEQALESDQKQLKKVQQELKEAEEQVRQDQKKCYEQEKELARLRKQCSDSEKRKYGFEVALAEDLTFKKGIEQELISRYQVEPVDIPNLTPMFQGTLEEIENQIYELRTSLSKTGAVNMTAIDEYQETKRRFEYLDSQLKDLEESKKDLETIIAKLDRESRLLFKKIFTKIRENFQKNFEILFKGGTADLTFTDSSDILEAGIEIIARPPGKQMRSISLLSGGEKCLTALALLFSIFEVRPAPFCILDEVDAPLDDSNIDRFTRVLKQFIEKTQFIIVTHNKKTMAIADYLIGVSMEEKGVSKLISLVFEKTPQPALL